MGLLDDLVQGASNTASDLVTSTFDPQTVAGQQNPLVTRQPLSPAAAAALRAMQPQLALNPGVFAMQPQRALNQAALFAPPQMPLLNVPALIGGVAGTGQPPVNNLVGTPSGQRTTRDLQVAASTETSLLFLFGGAALFGLYYLGKKKSAR